MQKKIESYEMPFLDKPSEEEWQERQEWFDSVIDDHSESGSYIVSDQATALIAEVENAYCSGSWVAVITLALSAIDAQLREVELPDFKGNTKELFKTAGLNEKYDELRKRRNSIVHIDTDSPALSSEDIFIDESRMKLKAEAEEAIILMLDVFYMSPGT